MIVKVQLALHASDGVTRCLVYNKDRSVQYETEDLDIVRAMKGRSKVYFEASFLKAGVGGTCTEISLGAEVGAQDW